jgi:hypothetical protein
MNEIALYLREYTRSVNRSSFVLITLLTAVLVTINYTIGIEQKIQNFSSFLYRFSAFFLLFAFIFSTAWLWQVLFSGENILPKGFFLLLMLISPAIFAAKISFDWLSMFTSPPWSDREKYLGAVLSWPLKSILVLIPVTILWRWGKYASPVSGMRWQGFNVKPYFLLLLCMLPLIAFAATRPDFLHTYPKMQRIDFINHAPHNIWYKILFEASYGSDFFTIEFFFRGFLVIAFARYAGKDAILPMAAFYCSIHFGKPLFECITSYFGGIALGVVVYNTRSIWGGLIIHLGIAWLMELAGYLGHQL